MTCQILTARDQRQNRLLVLPRDCRPDDAGRWADGPFVEDWEVVCYADLNEWGAPMLRLVQRRLQTRGYFFLPLDWLCD